jgi:formylglycine-generating enzyme required for sulfatase activity
MPAPTGEIVKRSNGRRPIRSRRLPKQVSVDSFSPNPWGFFQVHGNVYDWLEDCGNNSYVNAPTVGEAWTTGNCDVHMLRGGAFSRLLKPFDPPRAYGRVIPIE